VGIGTVFALPWTTPSTRLTQEPAMVSPAKKKGLFSSIDSREDALKMTRDAAWGFLFVAALQALLGFLIAPSVLIDAAVLALLGSVLMKWHSRAAAVLLLLVSIGQATVTVLNQMGVTAIGGKNIYLAIIMVIVSVRAVEATFKLHGRFAKPPAGGMSNRAAA
jgi:hypothetical protein